MNKSALLFGVGASLILAAGTASAAGSCGAEVAELQQKIGVEEGANATIGATDPGVQQPSPSASVEGGASVDTSTGTTTAPAEDQVANTNNDANATIGAADTGVQQPAPESNAQANATTGTSTTTTTDTTTADNTGANATIGATDPGVQQPQSGGSDTLAEGSSSDTTTMPSSGTVEETSRVGDMNTSAGGRAEAITALKKAQMAADAGDEDACMTELGNAKTALGVE